MSFPNAWWEAFVISGRYGMGDPLARSSPIGESSNSKLSADTAVATLRLTPLSEDREQWRGEACPPARRQAGITRP
jgi:hypothetical protein